MSTRSNIILVTDNNMIKQYYHHCDGYLKGVGEELRRAIIFSLGMFILSPDSPFTDLIEDVLSYDDDYYNEATLHLSDRNCLHGDIEYLYIVKDRNLYYVREYGISNKLNSYEDLINYVCKDSNLINLKCHL